jgi:hypothetical protein
MVLKEVRRKETTFFGFERGEQERNSIDLVLNEVSREKISCLQLGTGGDAWVEQF